MTDVLDRIHAEIRERLRENRAAVEEYRLLEAAVAALGSVGEAPQPRRAAAPEGSRPRRRRSRESKPNRPRAARGANREAVLRVVADRPGVKAGELAAASGVPKPGLYTLLHRLVGAGELVKESLPGGQSGYSLPRAGLGTPPVAATAASDASTA